MNAPPRRDKFKAYRARKKAAGLRELRFWVPDIGAPHFQRELDAQIERINAAEDERDVLIFCELAAAEVWAAPD
ncbi:antitoxin MazE-like protein [uncultured Sphingomonas sp.]|uniref:antitoxin MazE-like protein n=1 Tax=uncultured Sphingomonas sp. TaxID=158754 RepID=UPI0035C9F358